MDSKQARWFVIIVLLPIFLIGILNWLIDPYDIFFSPHYKRINEIKTACKIQERLYRAIEVKRRRPDAIILGSSRPMCGIDLNYLRKGDYQCAYNAGFGGANIEEIYYFFEHAIYWQPDLKLVILGLDFFAFNLNSHPRPDFSHDYLKSGTLNLKHILTLSFSKTALERSYETVMNNAFDAELLVPYLPNGLHNPFLTMQNYFYTKDDMDYIKASFLDDSKMYLNFELDYKKINFFQKIVERCLANNIELKVFVCPTKAIYWEAVHRMQLWTYLEDLKRRLSAIWPIWDFSGYNPITTQSIEQIDNPLYFECSHFRPYTGNLILDRLFDQPQALQSFGYYLTPGTVEDILVEIRKDRLNWLNTKPKELEKLDLIINPKN